MGDAVTAKVNESCRHSIMRNHTGAHLLQAALREVLGDHVEQAGQLVNIKQIRFDFTHFSALTPEELVRIERIVNKVILEAISVESREMPIEEAKKMGAMALFGEKYGDIVRVVAAGDFSKEFCGGTHVDNTSKLGLFKITSESSVAAGVRRIEAVTGEGVIRMLNNAVALIDNTAVAMKLNNTQELAAKAQSMTDELKEKDRQIAMLSSKLAGMEIQGLFETAKEVEGVKIVSALFSGTESDALRTMCDKARDFAPNIVAVLAGTSNGKATIAVACGKSAQEKGAHAGNIVRAVAKIAGGNGGGKADSAMAGAKDLTMLDEALAAVEGIVTDMIQ